MENKRHSALFKIGLKLNEGIFSYPYQKKFSYKEADIELLTEPEFSGKVAELKVMTDPLPFLEILEIKDHEIYLNEFMRFLYRRPLSYSSLKQFASTPRKYVHYMTAERGPSSLALILGSVIDLMILQPDKVSELVVVEPEKVPTLKAINEANPNKNEKECRSICELKKLEFDNFLDAHKNQLIVSSEEYKMCEQIRDSVMGNEAAYDVMKLISSTQSSRYWTDKETGLYCMARMDMEGENIIAELKSAISGEPDDFPRASLYFDYDCQGGMYLCSAEARHIYPEYKFIVVEKKPPYDISVFHLDSDTKKVWKDYTHHLLLSFKQCMDFRQWNMSYDYKAAGIGYFTYSLPPWAKKLYQ